MFKSVFTWYLTFHVPSDFDVRFYRMGRQVSKDAWIWLRAMRLNEITFGVACMLVFIMLAWFQTCSSYIFTVQTYVAGPSHRDQMNGIDSFRTVRTHVVAHNGDNKMWYDAHNTSIKIFVCLLYGIARKQSSVALQSFDPRQNGRIHALPAPLELPVNRISRCAHGACGFWARPDIFNGIGIRIIRAYPIL